MKQIPKKILKYLELTHTPNKPYLNTLHFLEPLQGYIKSLAQELKLDVEIVTWNSANRHCEAISHKEAFYICHDLGFGEISSFMNMALLSNAADRHRVNFGGLLSLRYLAEAFRRSGDIYRALFLATVYNSNFEEHYLNILPLPSDKILNAFRTLQEMFVLLHELSHFFLKHDIKGAGLSKYRTLAREQLENNIHNSASKLAFPAQQYLQGSDTEEELTCDAFATTLSFQLGRGLNIPYEYCVKGILGGSLNLAWIRELDRLVQDARSLDENVEYDNRVRTGLVKKILRTECTADLEANEGGSREEILAAIFSRNRTLDNHNLLFLARQGAIREYATVKAENFIKSSVNVGSAKAIKLIDEFTGW